MRLLDRKDEAVSAVLLGNSVVNILSASLTTAVLTSLFGAAGWSTPRSSSASWW